MSTLAVTLTGIAPATLTIELGTPGPQGPTGPTGATGPQGPAGPGVPAGGTAGQYLQKTTTGVDYATDWVTLNLSAYAPLASPAFTGNPTAPTAALADNDTSIATTAFVQQELLSGTANARNLEVYVRNQTGSTIPAGSIVYINGATGNRPTITLAQANNDANSAQTMGFTKTAIANNAFGFVVVRGEVENLNTSALTEGVQLYLSPTTAGTWTTTKPSAPQHLVYVGICVRAHPTQGVILVAVQNGYELPELHDVKITSPTNGQVLKYDSAQSLWVNGTDSAPVTSVAGKTGAVTLVVGDVIGAAPLASPALSGNPTAPTPLTADNDTSIATTAFVKAQGYLTSAPVTSVAGRTGAVTLSNTDISGLGTMATATATDYLSKAGNLSGLASTSTARTNLGLGTISTFNDAPSDGSQYARKNGAWDVVTGGGGSSLPVVQIAASAINPANITLAPSPACIPLTYPSHTDVLNGLYATSLNYGYESTGNHLLILSGLTSLTNAVVSNNDFMTTAPDFTGLASLEDAQVSNNFDMTTAPDFTGCVGLTVANVNNNPAMTSAPDFSGCTVLTSVNVSNNAAMTSAPDFTDCTSLSNVNVAECAISDTNLLTMCSQIYTDGAPNGTLVMEGGTNGSFDGQNLPTEITDLQGNGWSVIFNDNNPP